MNRTILFLLIGAGVASTSCRAAPTTRPLDAPPTVTEPSPWPTVAKMIGVAGIERDDVFTITIPRSDLDLHDDNGPIPVAAGIESAFHFYRCPCGRTNVIGQFVVADYEANDVIDALRKNFAIRIASVGPFLLDERPRLLSIRFQGEGTAVDLATNIKAALDCTGKARMTTRPIE